MRLCDIEGCERIHQARGLCLNHYHVAHINGTDKAKARKRRHYRKHRERILAEHRERRLDPGFQRHKRTIELASAERTDPDGARRRAAWQRYEARKVGATVASAEVTVAGVEARMAYHGNRCVLCGTTEQLTMDHWKPLAKGGLHVHANLRPMCHSCNSGKRDTWPVV